MKRILVVDDEAMIRKLVQRMLETKNYSTMEASNGEEAIEIVKSTTDISCIILDLSMPGMSGEATLKELHGLRPDIKIIISSGRLGINKEFYLQQGASGFLNKPFKMDELFTSVN